MPRFTPVQRLVTALEEVADAIQVTQKRADDALRAYSAMGEACRNLRAVAQANAQTFVDVSVADSRVENADVTTEMQGAVTHARQAADGLAEVADRATGAYLDAQIQIDGLLTWLGTLGLAVQEADGIGDLRLFYAQQTARALARKLDAYAPLVPEMVRRAAAEGARGNPAVAGDGSLRGACARLAAVLERAASEAEDLDREVERVIRSGPE